MKFRTSWFNPTLALHHWKRSWPLPAFMLLWCLISYVLDFHNKMEYWVTANARDQLSTIYSDIGSAMITLPLLLAVGAFVAAILVFRHLHSRTASQFYLTMPMKRRCSYLTGMVSGWLFAMIPMVITVVILLCMSAANGLPAVPFLRMLIYGLGTWTIFYALAVLSCILGGNTAGSLLIYLGINGALYLFSELAGCIAGWFITGYASGPLLENAVCWLTPFVKLIDIVSYEGAVLEVTVPLIYLAAAIVILVLSGLLYQIRRAETAGETVAFAPMRIVCKVAGALIICVLGTVFVESCMSLEQALSFAGIVLLVLIFLSIGWIAAAMVIRRSFRVFDHRKLLGLAAAAVAVLLVMAAGKLDVTGYITRVPDLSQVTEAELVCDDTSVTLSPEVLLDLHETVLANRDELTFPTSSYCREIDLNYRLESGSWMHRTYYLPVNVVWSEAYDEFCDLPEGVIYDAVMQILSEPENNLQTWFPDWQTLPEQIPWLYGAVTETAPYSDVMPTIELTTKQLQTIYDAFVEDVNAGNVQPACLSTAYDNSLYTIELDYMTESFEDSGYASYEDYLAYGTESFATLSVTADMPGTLAALLDCGISVEVYPNED